MTARFAGRFLFLWDGWRSARRDGRLEVGLMRVRVGGGGE